MDIINSDTKYVDTDIEELKKYRLNTFVYNINGFIVSVNKVKRFMSRVLSSEIKELYTFNELLFYAIIYKYPKLVTRNDIINLKNILNINTLIYYIILTITTIFGSMIGINKKTKTN